MQRKLTIPQYIYAGRTRDELVPLFEAQFLRQVERYDDALMAEPDAFEMAKRIGYAHMKSLREGLTALQGQGAHPSVAGVAELGDSGFSWRYAPQHLGPDAAVLCFGVGTNISFEEQLAEEVGCVVHCFDPTPQAMEYALPIARENPKLRFYPWGILSRDGIEKFYRSSEVGIGSLSTSNIGYGAAYMEAPVYRLLTIMRRLGLDKVDLLKIDIEGAEYDVIDDVIFSGVRVDQFCLEFDQPVPPWRTDAAMRKLYLAGYAPIESWGLNWLFVHERLLTAQ